MWASLGGRCVRGAELRALWGVWGVAVFPSRARALHGSAVVCGSKNLLKKFACKTRKKFWYEGPSLGSHLTHKPSKLEFLTKTSKKTTKGDQVRLRTLNGLLFKALTDLLCTPEVSQEVYDLNVELSKVSLTSDFSACRVYWKTGLSADQNKHTEAVLQRSAAHMRHLVMSQQTLKNVPPIVFIQDRKDALLAKVDQLLAVADFGPPEEKDSLAQGDLRNPGVPSPYDAQGPAMYLHLCGIDHEALNKKIMEYKRRKEKGLRGVTSMPPLLDQQQVAGLTQLVRRKKKFLSYQDWDASPRSEEEEKEEEDEEEEKESEKGCEC
ncbi:putative ribosome-binding factor A, mitochondrial isoform X2 [Perognathus longimembris pacificus]|uniref:putative ribosome-binding factor A, mitochondrial isoform X2 n=1 Tax=Perognathus longimembris pacificus TaxID=214514 RepID=UPI00201936F9|nr:putative ribosome-binding factor A, mitochondrial isoform X2 [Perognathus longimembris pacificus]